VAFSPCTVLAAIAATNADRGLAVNDFIASESPPVTPDPLPAAAVTPPPPPDHAVQFTGSRNEFRRLVWRGAALEFVTLGFYRFWLATDIRRHLWSNTAVEGDALEYTGTAKELLIGFLFALAILVPIYLAYFFIGLEAERLQAFASVPLGLFFFLFYQFAMYRARRYRLSRTIWRGVRFWMTGSGWSYAWRVGLWSLLAIGSLGLALPWYQAALERYKMKHSYYGDLPGRFDGRGWDLFCRFFWFWFGSIVLIIATGALVAWRPATAGLFGLALVIAAPFAYAAYKAIEWRWWASGIRFGEVHFESTLSHTALTGLYWAVIGWSILILVFLGAWFTGVVFMALRNAGVLNTPNAPPEAFVAVAQRLPVLIGMGAGYFVAALAFATVVRIHLRRHVWARVVASTTVHNLEMAANVSARGEAAGALGEGFADNLDIGGF
jgi:uncharacterized membrane protein YjgN (DUF898 family)